jgi:hypothetical protein
LRPFPTFPADEVLDVRKLSYILRASAGGIMKKQLSAVTLFLTSFCAYAAVGEMNEVANAPVELVDMAFVVLFLILFFGSIAWFFFHVWRTERKRKQDQ